MNELQTASPTEHHFNGIAPEADAVVKTPGAARKGFWSNKTLRSTAALVGFGAVTAVVAGLGTLATRKSVNSAWYRLFLKKPAFQPPRAVFAPVWTGLYGLMALSAWRVWKAPESKARTQALGLWGGQLALNGAWSAIFFGQREPAWALVDIALLDGALGAYAYKAAQVDKTAAWLVAPYIGWNSFATVLNGSIAYMNR